MKRLAVVAVLGACQSLTGIEDTKLMIDAAIDAPDAPPDAPIDAPPQLVDIGDGRDGPIVVTAVGFTDDVRAGLTEAVGAGSTLMHVTTADGFAVGDEVVIIQMTGPAAGHYETNRVASAAPGTLTLTSAVAANYDADTTSATQVVHIPNYASVSVEAGGVLGAHAWDGTTGGVLFFRVSGTLTVAAGASISADATGFGGGLASTPTEGGTGGRGGPGGGRLACPALGCSLGSFMQAGTGGAGGTTSTGGQPGGEGPQVGTICKGGTGGVGGISGDLATQPEAPASGVGPTGATLTAGGSNVTSSVNEPLLGGGGAGGRGGRGGAGAGGGGGGGGVVGGQATDGPSGPGANGGDGGDGGPAGHGGVGGGIVIVAAETMVMLGDLGARGHSGDSGIDGLVGGSGGFGGFSGGTPACGGSGIPGGRGGGGGGAAGGDGGSGGHGGAGGVIALYAESMQLAGTVRATGGAGGSPGTGAIGGEGGEGFEEPAPGGEMGTGGAAGSPGTAGSIYITFVDDCTGCTTASDPQAAVTDL